VNWKSYPQAEKEIKMRSVNETPSFHTWQKDSLVAFCEKCYVELLAQQKANEQLRLDFKDAMKMARMNNMAHNTSTAQNHTITKDEK
jgi:uncharacterized protein CbrC (UPF0167 family)